MKRYLLSTLALILAGLVFLVGFFPATWAWSLLHQRVPHLHAEALHGSVWNGRADGVEYAGMRLGEVHWHLAREALLGRIRAKLEVDGPLVEGGGHLRRRGGALEGEQLHFVLHAARLPLSLGSSGLRPRGDMVFEITRLRIRGNWPQQLQGRVTWHAALTDHHGPVALGELHAQLQEQAGSIIEARFSDGGGPLSVSGTAQLSPLGWRLDANLRARGDNPGVRNLLAHFGTVRNDGTLVLRRHGGLTMGEGH